MAPKRKRHGGKKAIDIQPDDDKHFFLKELSRKKQKSRKVKVKRWQGEIRVDIRKYFLQDGIDMHSKKGISLNVDEWNKLKGCVGEIDEAIAKNL